MTGETSEPTPIDRITAANLPMLRTSLAFLIPILKEPGYSSAFFVNGLRRRLSHIHRVKRFRVGHAGTLDPFASGVLVVLGGKATRLQDSVMHQPKAYEATMCFGATSPSLDPDTDVTSAASPFTLDPEQLRHVLPRFVGEIEQVPPEYSAKHVGGRRAYAIARAGGAVTLEARRVRVDGLELLGVDGNEARVSVRCGSGVYIRSLARDLAAALGTVGYLIALVRTEAGRFRLEECIRLREALDATGEDTATPPLHPPASTPV